MANYEDDLTKWGHFCYIWKTLRDEVHLDKVGDVKDRVCVLLDDMSDSCGTLCKVIIITL